MAKIIRLTESDLTKIVKRVIEEQMGTQTPIDIQMKKIRPEMGGKYCFGNPKQLTSEYGNNVRLLKLKNGDTLSGILSNHPLAGDVENIISINKSCELSKGLKAGDVIAVVLTPSK